MKQTVAIIIGIACVLLCCQLARADLVEQFRTEYPSAARRLEDAYSHVKIYGTKITRDNRPGNGNILSVEKERYFRDGDHVMHEVAWIKSNDPKQPPGTIQVASGDSERSFSLRKPTGNKHFIIDRYGSLPNFWQDLRLHLYPLFAVDCMIDQSVMDFCKQPTVEIISAKMTKFDGADAIELTARQIIGGDTKPTEFYFQPHTWALLGWMRTMHGEKYPPKERAYFSCKITYVPNSDPPKLASLKYWIASKKASGKPPIYEFHISKVEFGPVPRNQFTLAAFGVENPGHTSGPNGYKWGIISAIVLVVLGVLFEWLHRRSKSNGSPPRSNA